MKALQILLILAVCSLLAGCASSRRGRGDESLKLLRITADVDGSGRIVFTRDHAVYEHFFWQLPSNVTINGTPWSNLRETPVDWIEFSQGLKLPKARVRGREGRDVIALETMPEGFAVYLSDTPGGAAPYEIIIAIPQK